MSTSRRRVRPECGTQAGHTTTIRGCAEATDIAGASVPDDPTCQLAAEKMFDTCTMPRRGSTEPPEQVSWRRSCATGTRRTRAGEAADHVAYMYSRDPPLLRLRLEPHRLRSTYSPTHGTGDVRRLRRQPADGGLSVETAARRAGDREVCPGCGSGSQGDVARGRWGRRA